MDRYDDLELVRKNLGTLYAGLIQMQGNSPLLPDREAEAPEIDLEPGQMIQLPPGATATMTDPPDSGDNYGAFMDWQAHAVASGVGVTFEQMTGNLKGVNYSSIRAGMLEFRRRIESLQHAVFVSQLCRPVWDAWLQAALQSGALPVEGYASVPDDFHRSRWVPQGWRWIDPAKEIAATIHAVRAGVTTRSQAIRESGQDPEMVDREIASDNERADDLGLVLDTDPRKVTKVGMLQKPDEQE
jgi:lambda family phage portal protein